MTQDVRHAVRALRRNPGFTAIAVISLAFGIGVNSAVFSVVDALLFRPLPYTDADRLVNVYEHHPAEVCAGCGVGTSWPAYLDVLESARSLEDAAATRSADFALELPGGTERWRGAYASASLFPLLGVAPLAGRTFDTRDDAAGSESVILLHERLWRARFGGAAEAVGAIVRMNGRAHTVVGVMPETFAFPPSAELWVPIAPAMTAAARSDREVDVVARLAPGSTVDDAARELRQLAANAERAYPATNAGWTMRVTGLRADLAADYAPSFLVMLGVVGFVLLVACANVANLVLARFAARRHELAVRASLGASRADLARHVLVESVLIGVFAGVLALLVTAWALDAFTALTAGTLPRWVRYGLDARVALFAGVLSLVTGVLAGIAPALHVTRREGAGYLADIGRSGAHRPQTTRIRNALVAVQVGAAMTLVAGAMFLTREFLRIVTFEPGYVTEGLYGARVLATSDAYDDARRIAALADELMARLSAATGTRDVALSSMYIPNWPGTAPTVLRAEGRAPEEIAGALHRVINVTPAYFRTHGTPIVAGRDFTPEDRAGAQPVGIVGHALAERLWPGENPLGRQLHLGGPEDAWITIVGVVRSTRASPFARDTSRFLYLPLAQHATVQPAEQALSLHIRPVPPVRDLAATLRAAIADVDRSLVVEDIISAQDAAALAQAPARTTALAAAGLGAFAVLLAGMGIFGVIAFTVSQRVAEIGVRIALGATRARITRMVLGQALRLAALGLAFGVPGAIALGSVLRAQLVNARPPGFLALGGLLVLFAGIVTLASWLPARRAARVDPIAALRAEG